MKVALISTFAKDYIYNANGILLRKQRGGPAFFITNVFKEMGLSFSVIPSPELKIEIMLKDGDEFGKLPSVSPLVIDCNKINTPFLAISPIIDEFELMGIDKYKGKIFLDAQGFTREVGEFGKKKKWKPEKAIEHSIFCLKVADYELPYINEHFIKNQKKKILLLTQGSKGCTVYAFGESFIIRPKKIVKSSDTLGAGDTFFAYFLTNYIRTNDQFISAEIASDKTLEFLTAKGF